MISYIEYLNIPIALGLAIIGVFLIMQIVGEILEFKGKVVPEFIKIRKYFARKKQERQTMREMSATIHDVKTVLNSVESSCRQSAERLSDVRRNRNKIPETEYTSSGQEASSALPSRAFSMLSI